MTPRRFWAIVLTIAMLLTMASPSLALAEDTDLALVGDDEIVAELVDEALTEVEDGDDLMALTDGAGADEVQTCTVTFDVNGGEGQFEPVTVAQGDTVAAPAEAPVRDGYVFTGWRLVIADIVEGEDFFAGEPRAVDGDITLIAGWEAEDAGEAPVEAAEEPAEAAEEPVEAAEEPVEAAEEPVEAAEEPVEAAEEPTEAVEEPVEAAEEPVEAIEEPVEAAEEPVEAIEKPVEAIEEPVEAAEEPVEAAEEPVEAIEEPVEAAEEPVEEPVEEPAEEPAEEPVDEETEIISTPVDEEPVAAEVDTEEFVELPCDEVELPIDEEAPEAAGVQTRNVLMDGNVTHVAKIGETGYETLADAVAAANGAGTATTIQLLQNVVLNAGVDVSGSDVTLDLAGHTISNGANITGDYLIAVLHGGKLTVKDSQNAGKISMSKSYCAIKMTKAGGDATNKATLVVESGTIEGYNYGISGNGNNGRQNTSVTINGGTIKATAPSTCDDTAAIYQPQKGDLIINGGSIEGPVAVYAKSGTVTVKGGALKGTAEKKNYTYNGGMCKPTGDALVIDNCGYPGGAPSATITGGTFNSANAKGIGSYYGSGVKTLANVYAKANTITIHDDDDWKEVWIKDSSVEGCSYKLVQGFTVTFNANGGKFDDDTDEVAIKVEKGKPTPENEKPNDPKRDGYTFDGWFEPEATTKFDFTTSIEKDTTLTAHWSIVQYDITYALNGGAVATANPTTYTVEDAFTLTNPTREGYTFAGWTGTDLNEATKAVTVAKGSTGGRTYTATWTAEEYGITYTLNGGEVATANPASYTIETDAFTLTNPTREGYTFAGWTGTGLDGATKAVTVAKGSTGKRAYTATWTAEVYDITYALNDGAVATANPTTYTVEDAFTLTNPTREGYTFAGWTGTGLDGATKAVTVAKGSTGGRAYTATWTVNKYTLTFDTDGGSEIKPITQDFDTAITAPADPTKEGYSFTGWKPEIPQTMPARNVTVTAQFEIKKFDITWVDGNGKTLKTDKVAYGRKPVYSGQTPAKATTAQYTYTFAKQWSPEVVEVTGDAVYTAKFTQAINSYAITWLDAGGNTLRTDMVPYGDLPVYDGKAPTRDATAEFTYEFTGWTPEVASVTGEAAYTAVFTGKKNKYTITWQDEEGKTIDTTSVEYGKLPEHDDPKKAETAAYTYTFDGWTPKLSAVTGDATYRASFAAKAKVYKLTVVVDDAQTVESYNAGAKVTVPADPQKTGYTFTGWDPEIPETMPTEDVTVTAQWKKNKYTITFDTDGGSAVASVTVDYMGKVNPPADPTKEEFVFNGWKPELPETMPAEDLTVKAQWKEKTYTVNVTTEGLGTATASVKRGVSGTKVSLTATAGKGYRFDSWKIVSGGVTLKDNAFTIGKSNVKLVARFTQKPTNADFTLLAKMTSNGARSLDITWTKVKYADGYDVFCSKCGKDNKYELAKTVRQDKEAKCTVKKLKKNASYKAYVSAWVMVGDVKTYIGDPSPVVHEYTGGGDNGTVTNPKKVTLQSKKSVSLTVGMTSRIQAAVVGQEKGKNVLQHEKALRYFSSNKKVATVTSGGKIKAVAPGACTIYVLANNGAYKSVKVTVKAGPTGVSFKKTSYKLNAGKKLNLAKELVLDPDGVKTSYTWTTSDKKIATVDAKGVVKAKKAGKVKITVKTANGLKKSVKITVK